MNATEDWAREDVIDLQDAWRQVWAARWLVVAVTLVTTVISALLVWILVPVEYETRVELLPPRSVDVSAYALAHQLSFAAALPMHNGQDTARGVDSIPALSVDQAYRMFLRHLTSTKLRDRFFLAHFQDDVDTAYLSLSDEQQRERLDTSLQIVLPEAQRDASQRTSVIWRGTDPEQIAVWANTYVAWAMEAAEAELLADLRSEIQLRQQSTQALLDVLRQSGVLERRFEMARVGDALQLAQAIGLDKPAKGFWVVESELQERPYLQGSQALQAQLEGLMARENDDAYISALESVQHRQVLLEALAAQSLTIQAAVWDAPAQAPIEPLGPSRWVLVLGGGGLGVLLALGWVLGRAGRQRSTPTSSAQPEGRGTSAL